MNRPMYFIILKHYNRQEKLIMYYRYSSKDNDKINKYITINDYCTNAIKI